MAASIKNAKTHPLRLKTLQRDELIIQDRLAGMKLKDIAVKHNTWASNVSNILTRYALEQRKDVYEGAEELRKEQGHKLDELEAAIWDKAIAGDDKKIQSLIKIIAQRCKLFGLEIQPNLKMNEDNVIFNFNIVPPPPQVAPAQPAEPVIDVAPVQPAITAPPDDQGLF